MLPDHCKDVSVRDVNFKLTLENILDHARGKKAYTRTEYMILRHGEENAIIRVHKKVGKELFRIIENIEVIALPEQVVMIKDESVDVLDLSQMSQLAERHSGKFVIVQGLFNHVSFIGPDDGKEVFVFDVVPPNPPKLFVLVQKALSAGLVNLPLIPRQETLDLNELCHTVTGDIMFPCKASGVKVNRNAIYLDETPELEGEVTLIGCDLSRRIFKSIYGRSPAGFIDMCPQNLAPRDGKKRILKCCRIREGFELHDNLAIVPWGATVKEIADALNALFKD